MISKEMYFLLCGDIEMMMTFLMSPWSVKVENRLKHTSWSWLFLALSLRRFSRITNTPIPSSIWGGFSFKIFRRFLTCSILVRPMCATRTLIPFFQVSEGSDQFSNKVSTINSNPNQVKSDPEALAQTVKSLMEKCHNPLTKTKPFSKAYICKVCGKEGLKHHVADHVEANHMEGISLPCNICEKTFRARNYLRKHKSKHHR